MSVPNHLGLHNICYENIINFTIWHDPGLRPASIHSDYDLLLQMQGFPFLNADSLQSRGRTAVDIDGCTRYIGGGIGRQKYDDFCSFLRIANTPERDVMARIPGVLVPGEFR